MNIHQISVNYVQEQDRCLVRINSHDGDELRLWFTRRLALGLMPYLNQVASEQLRVHAGPSNPAVPIAQRRTQMLENFQKEADFYQGDYKTPFKPQPATLPLGAEPLLITEIKLALQPNGQVDLQLIEQSGQQVRNIALDMNPQLVQGLLHLLAEAIKTSQWLAVPAVVEPPMVQDPADEPMLARVEKPKYLN